MSAVTESALTGLNLAVANAAELTAQLCDFFIERDREVACALLALVAGEHFMMIGPPGTAKSMLTRTFAAAICDVKSEDYFKRLMTKFTVPSEMFGPISLKGLENDEYRHVTGRKLPRAKVAFLDETFKANSAILNALLTMLEEREFENGTALEECPLEVCFGASNEFPADESLGALFDRFVLRRWVDEIRDRDQMKRLLMSPSKPNITARLTGADIAELRAARERVDMSGICDALLDVRDSLAKDGIKVGDRRWVKCVKLVRAAAALDGRDYCETEDMLVLADALWDNKDDRPAVLQALAAAINPDLVEAMSAFDAAVEAFGEVDRTDDATFKRTAGTANAKLIKVLVDIDDLTESDHPLVADLRDKVAAMQLNLAKQLRKMRGF